MTRYLEQANECTDPAAGDYLWIYNASAGATDKDQKVDITRFGVKANTGTWTATQTFAPSAGSSGVSMTTPANQTTSMIFIGAADCGSSYGPHISISRNSNASTPAAGWLQVVNRSNTAYSLWVDNSGNVRVGTSTPTNANDGSGTVIGAQTSYIELKEDVTPWNDTQDALDAVLACKLFGYRFKADEGRRQYHGIVITDEDRGAWFSENDAENQTPALNERNLFGHLIAAIQAQQAQIDELKAKVEALIHAN